MNRGYGRHTELHSQSWAASRGGTHRFRPKTVIGVRNDTGQGVMLNLITQSWAASKGGERGFRQGMELKCGMTWWWE
jgi:hypothetical protein